MHSYFSTQVSCTCLTPQISSLSFLFKAKKAAMITPPPPPPLMPRLIEDVVPDDRDDVDIILNTTTVSLHYKIYHKWHTLSALVFSIMYLSPSVSIVQYYYSVRIFAGQEPSEVWVGWVTPDFHMYDLNFDLSKVRTVTVTVGDDKGNIHDRWDHIKNLVHTRPPRQLLKCGPVRADTRSCNAENYIVKNKSSI